MQRSWGFVLNWIMDKRTIVCVRLCLKKTAQFDNNVLFGICTKMIISIILYFFYNNEKVNCSDAITPSLSVQML